MKESRCPLCGAKVTAVKLLDSVSGVVDPHLHVLGTHCPFCQGYLELRPDSGKLEVGYLAGSGNSRFDVVYSLSCEGLEVESQQDDPPGMVLRTPARRWEFGEV